MLTGRVFYIQKGPHFTTFAELPSLWQMLPWLPSGPTATKFRLNVQEQGQQHQLVL
jgi:hypothetical protein